MRTRRVMRAGFTLVEILIVVVILGILAAIVVPQFTSASNEAVKGALQSQLQTINSQVELFRVRNNGAYPDFATAGANEGWDDLLGVADGADEYLKEAPVNGYTGQVAIAAGDEATAIAATRDDGNGWYFVDDDTADDYFTVYAAGYDETNNLLAHEQTEDPAPAP